ncbi:MAG: hypothetical protein KKB22_08245 [Candidatus Omnitrophica bacterium]|nr:hypothetical protein [Candidatus Omnitrophota bacterium]
MFVRSLKRAVSVFILITFTATNSIYAAPESKSIFKNKKVNYQKISDKNEGVIQQKKAVLTGEDAKEAESQKREAQKILSTHLSDISLIHIPQELGKVVEVYQNPDHDNSRLIVHIQDLHTNPEATLNLAGILEILVKDYNLGLVCSEGADGEVDTSSVSSFPDPEVRKKVARLFVDSGELTGEEYLSITKYPDLPIWGIENKEIYFKNIEEFNSIMKFNPDSQVFISQAKKALEELKPKIYSKELLAIDQKEADYESQKAETADHLKYLSSYIQKLNIPTANYKNIAILNETIDKESKIDQQKIMQESQNLLLNLQSAIAAKSIRSDMDTLMAKASLFKDEKLSPFSFYSYLKDLADKYLKDQVSKYPNLMDFVDYLTKVNSLESVKLFVEMENLSYEIKQKLAKNDEEKNLTQALRNIKFLESFFNLKISNEELDYYLNNRGSHKVAFFEVFLKPAIKKYNLSGFVDFNPNLIDSHLQEIEDFYNTVKARDMAMFTNATSEVEKRNVKVATLITGGFHTKGLTRLLKEKGYSYIVISPFSKTEIDEKNYHFLLSGKRKPIEDLIKQLDQPEVANKPAANLRVPLAFDKGSSNDRIEKAKESLASNRNIGEILSKEAVPAIARLTELPESAIVIAAILDRAGSRLGMTDKGASTLGWEESPFKEIVFARAVAGGLIIRVTSKGDERRYFAINKKGDYFRLSEAGENDFRGSIKVSEVTPQGIVRVAALPNDRKLASNSGLDLEAIKQVIDGNKFLKANTPNALISRIEADEGKQRLVLNGLGMLVAYYNWVTSDYVNRPEMTDEERTAVINEVQNDTYKPMITCLRIISRRLENGNLVPDTVNLKLSDKDQTVPEIRMSRRANVSLLPMKGDPWQIGHIWSILRVLADGSDMVVIMLDNSDPERKPQLTALPIREADSQWLFDAFSPFVVYTRFQRDRGPLLTADGETILPTLIYENRVIIDLVNWQYIAGYDHFKWVVSNSTGLLLDTPHKLFFDMIQFLREGLPAHINARFNKREADSKDSDRDVKDRIKTMEALTQASSINFYADLAISLAQEKMPDAEQAINGWRQEMRREIMITLNDNQKRNFEQWDSESKDALNEQGTDNSSVKIWLNRFKSATVWVGEDAFVALRQTLTVRNIDGLINTLRAYVQDAKMSFEVIEQPMNTSSTDVRRHGKLYTVPLPIAHSIIGLQRYPAFTSPEVWEKNKDIATEAIAFLIDLGLVKTKSGEIVKRSLVKHLGPNLTSAINIDILTSKLNERLANKRDEKSIIFDDKDGIEGVATLLKNAHANALHTVDSYLVQFILRDDMRRTLFTRGRITEDNAIEFINNIRDRLIGERAAQIIAQSRQMRLAERMDKDTLVSNEKVIAGLSFMPTRDFKQGIPLDHSLIVTTKTAEEARALLQEAKAKGIALSIQGHLRGVDGAGSSLDLPEFQLSLTKQDAQFPSEYPSTPTIASEFSVKINFELLDDPNAIEYIAPDYGITADNPYKITGDVILDKNGRTAQKDAPAFIFRNIFGLSGVKITCEGISPIALAGGMESSNVFNVALIAAASMLSGADLSYADIFNLAVKLENDEFAGLTGGQGHIGTMTGGAYQHIWLSGARDASGKLVNPYSAFSIPLLTTEDQFKAVEGHMMLVQAGKKYINGKAQVGRAASLTNNMWTDLLRDRDSIGLPLHQEKLGLTAEYTKALKEGDFDTVVRVITRYVEIRDELCKRWLALAIDAHNNVQGLPSYAFKYASKVFDENNPDYKEYELVRTMYQERGDALKDVTLYNLGAELLVKDAKEAGIALMGLGAGGQGANLIAISAKGNDYTRKFLEDHGINELTNEGEARSVIRGTGELKGYMPFRIGREGLQIKGFDQIGITLPGKATEEIKPLSTQKLASNEGIGDEDDFVEPIRKSDTMEGKENLRGEEIKMSLLATGILERSASIWQHVKDGRGETFAPDVVKWLGWVTAPEEFLSEQRMNKVRELKAELAKEGITNVVVLGTGGSGLGIRTYSEIYGKDNLRVVDLEDPREIKNVKKWVSEKGWNKTIFVVSSKSFTTIETRNQDAIFREEGANILGQEAVPQHFVAITDEGMIKPVEESRFRLMKNGDRAVFVNNHKSDAAKGLEIGGRYSTDSYFSMVPAELAGIPHEELLIDAKNELGLFRKQLGKYIGVQIGAALNRFRLQGRNKITFILSEELKPFGPWVQQLINESLGKNEDTAVVCVTGEGYSSDPSVYGNDRVFVRISIGEKGLAPIEVMEEQGSAPIIALRVDSKEDINILQYRFKIATTVLGNLIAVHPFDQPFVQSSKQITGDLLRGTSAELTETLNVKAGENLKKQEGGVKIYFKDKTESAIRAVAPGLVPQTAPAEEILAGFLGTIKGGDYVYLSPYTYDSPELQTAFSEIRVALRDNLSVHPATLFGIGSRCQHSDNQLNNATDKAVVIVFTFDTPNDIKVPIREYTLAQENMAHALGTVGALEYRGRRIIRIHLSSEYRENPGKIKALFENALRSGRNLQLFAEVTSRPQSLGAAAASLEVAQAQEKLGSNASLEKKVDFLSEQLSVYEDQLPPVAKEDITIAIIRARVILAQKQPASAEKIDEISAAVSGYIDRLNQFDVAYVRAQETRQIEKSRTEPESIPGNENTSGYWDNAVKITENAALGSNSGLSRKNQVDSMNQIVVVSAKDVVGNKKGFEDWIKSQPENIAVVIIAFNRFQYNGIQEYKDIAHIRLRERAEAVSKLYEMFDVYGGKPEFFKGFKLGTPASIDTYKAIASDISSGV